MPLRMRRSEETADHRRNSSSTLRAKWDQATRMWALVVGLHGEARRSHIWYTQGMCELMGSLPRKSSIVNSHTYCPMEVNALANVAAGLTVVLGLYGSVTIGP